MANVHSETKYAIATSDFRCLVCADEVACEALYYSAVVFGDGAFQRRNYCVNCWKRNLIPKPGETETKSRFDVFASWRSRRPAAPSERPKKIRFDPRLGLAFFLRLGEEPDEALAPCDDADSSTDSSTRVRAFPVDAERDQLRFFLSLLLVRKKALRFKSSIDRGGQEFLLLVDRETPPCVHEVLNPSLSEGQLEGLKDRLGELLQMQI